jgi:hypothetical protein
MADESVTLEPNVGVDQTTQVAVDDVAGVAYQRLKLDTGGDGVASPVTEQVPGTLPTSGASLALRTDNPSAGAITYVGDAAVGAATSAAAWRIKRITVSGDLATVEWADGNQNFDNIWDNRASLTYS